MRIRDFEFNLRELAGSMGDFGTLLPLAIGYFAVNGLNPAGLLVMMGLANIVTGIIYRLPMPIEPKKVLAATAIAQKWPPSLIYASGLGTGIIWLILSHWFNPEDSRYHTEERSTGYSNNPGHYAGYSGIQDGLYRLDSGYCVNSHRDTAP